MNFNQAKNNIIRIEWYQQGAAAKPLYVSYPLSSCSLMKILRKKIPVKYEILVNIKKDFMDDYISKRSLEKVGKFYFGKQKKDARFIFELNERWHKKYAVPYLKLIQKISDEDLTAHTNKKFFNIFERFTRTYLKVWHEVIFLDAFDYLGEKILEDTLDREGKDIHKEDLEVLLSPPLSSFLQKERLEILKLAEKISKNRNYENTEKDLEKLSSKFYWLQNDFAKVHYLNMDHFAKKLFELLRSRKKMSEEKEMRKWLRDIERRKKRLSKKYKFSKEFVSTIKFLAILGNLRDARKSYNQMAGNTLRKFAEEFSRRSGLEINTIEYMFHWEIKEIFKISKKRIKDIESRPKGWLYFISGPNKFTAAKGAQAAKLNAFLKKQVSKSAELKGMPAYAGVVQDEVRIIRDQNDFHKMRKGNILVSPNTRPEFVPVIKIAGAVVTDEGGMTSHAAIVSRELKIPTVVGVQGATTVLKDGDLVEVDANRGVIIISKSKKR